MFLHPFFLSRVRLFIELRCPELSCINCKECWSRYLFFICSYGDGSCVHAAALHLNCLIYFKKLLVLMTFHSKQFSFYPGAVFSHSTSFYSSRLPRRSSITLSAPPAHLSPSLFSDSLSLAAPL